jgi:hypothetical protein
MYTRLVRQFTTAVHLAKGWLLPVKPELMRPEDVAHITKMVESELDELAEAKTPLEQADALVDAIYYICDRAVRHGLNLDDLFHAVHAANMRKLVDGKAIVNAEGKVLKPAGWVGPDADLESILERHEADGSFAGFELTQEHINAVNKLTGAFKCIIYEPQAGSEGPEYKCIQLLKFSQCFAPGHPVKQAVALLVMRMLETRL